MPTPPPLVPNPAGYPTHIVIAGISATPLVRVNHLGITDVLNEQPNTATLSLSMVPHLAPSPPFNPGAFDAVGFNVSPSSVIYPSIRRGQPIEIYSGGQGASDLVFAGEIVTVRQVYELQIPDRDSHVTYQLSCIDHTRALNRRKVTKSYPTQSATAIVLDLMSSRLADGFTTQFVAAGLPAVAIDFTFEDMNRALTRLANRIGGYWYVDYTKALHFFLTEPADPPAPLIPGERFADFAYETDLSQVRTRVIVEGAGTNVATAIGVGETVIPVRDPVMFQPAGGLAVIGQQRIEYTGVTPGGTAGTLVGPGAQPASAPIATPAAGDGIELGAHGYAVTFVSASGESLPSPVATVTLGQADPPPWAPTPNPPTPGSGPDPGTHYYAVSFVTANGETTPSGYSGPVVTTQAGGVPAPGATAAAIRNVVGNLLNGVAYRYQTTITTADGETLPGAASTAITPAAPNFPAGAMVSGAAIVLSGEPFYLTPGVYYYAAAYVVGGTYETRLDAQAQGTAGQYVQVQSHQNAIRINPLVSSDPRVTGIKLYRSIVNTGNQVFYLVATLPNAATPYTDKIPESSLGAGRTSSSPAIGTPPGNQATITIPSSADPRATGRRIYRSDNGAPFRRLASIGNITATEYIDNTASVATDPDAPTVDTTGGALTCVVPLTGIPIGPAGVTGRRLYRTTAVTTELRLLATINNNTATTFTDNKTDSTLGTPPPATNTTVTRQVDLSRIPIGGAGVTVRSIYRTAANSSQLRYLTSVGDNVTTTYHDAASDSALGVNAPTVDTSGLQQPQGQVNAGSTTLPVSSASAFSASGGFAFVGNGEQVIRYTGITATALIGIPATGPGALTATVAYNSSVTTAPVLTGVTGITARGLVDGEEIHLLIVRDDLAAQAALAAIEGGSGVIEHYIQDRRLSAAGATTTADAELALFNGPEIRITYTTRDTRTRTGKPVAVNLPAPVNLAGEFLIQRVQFSQFHLPGVPPLRTVQASSTRFSFEDVLRRLELEIYA